MILSARGILLLNAQGHFNTKALTTQTASPLTIPHHGALLTAFTKDLGQNARGPAFLLARHQRQSRLHLRIHVPDTPKSRMTTLETPSPWMRLVIRPRHQPTAPSI